MSHKSQTLHGTAAPDRPPVNHPGRFSAVVWSDRSCLGSDESQHPDQVRFEDPLDAEKAVARTAGATLGTGTWWRNKDQGLLVCRGPAGPMNLRSSCVGVVRTFMAGWGAVLGEALHWGIGVWNISPQNPFPSPSVWFAKKKCHDAIHQFG